LPIQDGLPFAVAVAGTGAGRGAGVVAADDEPMPITTAPAIRHPATRERATQRTRLFDIGQLLGRRGVILDGEARRAISSVRY
jgi:hypothetical protein